MYAMQHSYGDLTIISPTIIYTYYNNNTTTSTTTNNNKHYNNTSSSSNNNSNNGSSTYYYTCRPARGAARRASRWPGGPRPRGAPIILLICTNNILHEFLSRTPSPPTKSLGFRGFDSSKLLILKGGNFMSVEFYRGSPGKFASRT